MFPTLNTRFYTDTMFSTSKSLRGNKVAQVFTNGNGYDLFYPLAKEADAADALTEVIRTIGIPKELISDGAKAETQGKFGKVIKEYKIKQRISEPYSGWQNRAEAAIREIKRGIKTERLSVPDRPSGSGIIVGNGLQLSDDSPHTIYQAWMEGYRMK